MSNLMFTDWMAPYRWWSGAMTKMALAQWQLLESQCRAGTGVVDALLRRAEGVAPGPNPKPEATVPKPSDEPADLAQRVAWRLQRGLPPPREIYEVQNRGLIDWSRFPAWAQPMDPDVFEGCSHEG